MAPDITGPAVKTSSERIGKADGNWDTLDSKILEHLVRKNAVLNNFVRIVPRVFVPYCKLDSAKRTSLADRWSRKTKTLGIRLSYQKKLPCCASFTFVDNCLTTS